MNHQTRLTLPTDHPTPGTPTWILAEITHPTTTTRTEAHLTPCPTCHHLTLTGTADGLPARADPHRIHANAIPLYATAGRTIYHLENTGTTLHLHTTSINTPEHAGPLTLIPAHHCHHPPPHTTPLFTPPPPTNPNQEPPF